MTSRRARLILVLLIQCRNSGALLTGAWRRGRIHQRTSTTKDDASSYRSFYNAGYCCTSPELLVSRRIHSITTTAAFATAHPPDHETALDDTASSTDTTQQQPWESAPSDDDSDSADVVVTGQDSSSSTVDNDLGDNDDSTSVVPTSDNPLLDEYKRWTQAVNKAVTGLEKKQRSLQNELDKAQAVESTTARAQLLTSYLYLFNTPGVTTATVQDWENDGQEIELTLDPAYESASAEADALFQQVRKLKRGSDMVTGLLRDTSDALSVLQEAQMDLQSVAAAVSDDDDAASIVVDENKLRLVQDRLLRTSRLTNFQAPPTDTDGNSHQQQALSKNNNKRSNKKPDIGSPASNIRKLVSPAGCTILVGRNRRGNEYLTFQVARDKDVWMHARGSPGAHVLILQRRGAVPATAACWQLAANLAAFYSDARSERKAVVSAAEPKHLLKPRGAPLGAVKLRQELQVITAYPDHVPDELKQAREASGQEAEYYRATDKAKLRKRNKQAVAKAKQQQQQRAKKKKKKESNS